jgi:hypothetical protein
MAAGALSPFEFVPVNQVFDLALLAIATLCFTQSTVLFVH